MDIGYKDDGIFLLSPDEYGYYKSKILHENCWWWLRSSGPRHSYAALVHSGGSVYYGGRNVYVRGAVRPSLKYSNLESKIFRSTLHDDRFIFNEFPFRIIDEENKIAIAEVPITFDMYDEESNDYEQSRIRSKLLSWYETGVWELE